MKILFLTPYLPSRIRVRPFELLRVLSEQGHRIRLGTLAEFGENPETLAQLRSWGIDVAEFPLGLRQRARNLLRGVAGPFPLQYSYAYQPHLWEWTRKELASGSYDIVHVEHLRGAIFGIRILEAFPHGPPVVWDAVDAISWLVNQAREKASSRLVRLVAHLESGSTRRCETWLMQRFERVIVSGPHDQALLEASGKGAAVDVIANGVDSRYFAPAARSKSAPDALIFSGKMSFHANVSAAVHLIREIMPMLWESRPGVKLFIVGASPPRVLKHLSQRFGRGRIRVVGRVPDLRPYLNRASVAVAPLLYSVGIQNKVLEALSCGLPVVTYPCAARALSVQAGKDLLVAEDARTFADCVRKLLENPGLRERMGRAGREYVVARHNWMESGRKLEEVYESLLREREMAKPSSSPRPSMAQ